MQPEVKVNGAHYCDVLLLKQLLPDICQAAGDVRFQRTTRAQEHWAVATQDSRLHTQTRSQFCRLQITESHQECVCQKQQGISNIVDELCMVINRMTYYISQGMVETPIRRGGQLCCSSVANLLQHLFVKNYQNTVRFDIVIAKIKGAIFCLTVWYTLCSIEHFRQR